MSKKFLSILIVMILTISVGPVFAEDPEAERREFEEHKRAWVQDMRRKISCVQASTNWQQWERCHEEAERREKERHLQKLQEEQRRIQREMDELRRGK